MAPSEAVASMAASPGTTMKVPSSIQTAYVQNLLFGDIQNSDSPVVQSIRSKLNLQRHPEGGYFVETDRDPLQISNPFYSTPIYPNATARPEHSDDTDESLTRNASTTIHYYLDPSRPLGVFHRNKGRTIHTLHWGRGVYVLIHADEVKPSPSESSHNDQLTPPSTGTSTPNCQKARIETFTVGPNIQAGEKVQWIVEGGKFKASFLIPDAERGESEKGLLISETVVPGFEFIDHDFLTIQQLRELVGDVEFEELKWLLRENRVRDLDISE